MLSVRVAVVSPDGGRRKRPLSTSSPLPPLRDGGRRKRPLSTSSPLPPLRDGGRRKRPLSASSPLPPLRDGGRRKRPLSTSSPLPPLRDMIILPGNSPARTSTWKPLQIPNTSRSSL